MEYEQPPATRILSRILGSRDDKRLTGHEELINGTAAYEAFTVTAGFPRMGFTLGTYIRSPKEITVQSHGILFHDVKKPKWKSFDGSEYVTFSHSGEAYTLRGRGLYPFYLALMDCTLQSALEYEQTVFKRVAEDAPIIDRVQVTDVAEMVRRSREGRPARAEH